MRTHKDKVTFTERHGVRKWKQRELKLKTDKGGYKRVSLWKDGKTKDFLVHRLVAIAFLPTIEGKTLVNHKDGVSSNNFLDNLEWVDSKENVNHAFNNGLMKTNKVTKIMRKSDKEVFTFISRSKASNFLGKDFRYVSACITRGKKDLGEYVILD